MKVRSVLLIGGEGHGRVMDIGKYQPVLVWGTEGGSTHYRVERVKVLDLTCLVAVAEGHGRVDRDRALRAALVGEVPRPSLPWVLVPAEEPTQPALDETVGTGT